MIYIVMENQKALKKHFPGHHILSLPRSRFLDVTQRSPKKTAARETTTF